MKFSPIYKPVSVFILLLMLAGCYKEYYDVINPEKEVFNFVVTEAQRRSINSSRGQQYLVVNPVPQLLFADESYAIDRFEIRGDNTVNFTRKGFGVNMDRKITIYDTEKQAEIKLEEFKLLAMVYDYTYIENSTAVGLLKKVGLWPVHSFFTEVRLNNHTQGLYLFVEDPFEYFIEKERASCVIRRGYYHSIKSMSVSPFSLKAPLYYTSLFNRIDPSLLMYSGQQLYDTLSGIMDLEQYFTKLSIDMLIKNGDYTDEVVFYTKLKGNREVFCAFPWDYDDIFSDSPHEIGRDWAVGTLFGYRTYNSMDDVIADVGHKLLYSIEDDLDYKIATDSFLYRQYLNTLRTVIEKIDFAVIDSIFESTYEHISPFYENKAIVEQSQYDVDETTYDLFIANLADKRQMLRDRRNWILQELDLQQNP